MPSIPNPPFSKPQEWAPEIGSLSEFPEYPHLKLTLSTVVDFLRAEINVSRLNDIYKHLWIAGRKGHIRPLHKQLMLQRDIVITEDPTMHLVWFENTIFMKPIPVALLSWEFWRRFICVSVKQEGGTVKQERGAFYAAACGFLLSYTVLITHPSDYRLAVSHHLIPDMGWKNWCLLSHDIRTSFLDSNFPTERRWEYGELRLSRLNWIYKLTLRGYSYSYMFTEYRTYFSKNFQLLLLAFAYCSVVLAAMQVVMTSSEPGVWLADLCFKFSVLIILFVFAVVCAIVGLFVSLFVYHLLLTLAFKRKFRLRPQMA